MLSLAVHQMAMGELKMQMHTYIQYILYVYCCNDTDWWNPTATQINFLLGAQHTWGLHIYVSVVARCVRNAPPPQATPV